MDIGFFIGCEYSMCASDLCFVGCLVLLNSTCVIQYSEVVKTLYAVLLPVHCVVLSEVQCAPSCAMLRSWAMTMLSQHGCWLQS